MAEENIPYEFADAKNMFDDNCMVVLLTTKTTVLTNPVVRLVTISPGTIPFDKNAPVVLTKLLADTDVFVPVAKIIGLHCMSNM